MTSDHRLHVVAAGDIMVGDSSHFIGRGVGSSLRRSGAPPLLEHMREHLDAADLFIANLESPLSASPGCCAWERVYRGPAIAGELRAGRQTILTVANNHILEHGFPLLDETKSILAAAGVASVGYDLFGGDRDAVCELDAEGLTVFVGAVSFVRDLTGRRVDAEERTGWVVGRLRESRADIRIVSVHWGDEYVAAPSPAQRRIGHALVEAGAQLIVGHHPHVLQPVERVGSAVIAYSLGNFVFDQDWTDETRVGGVIAVDISREGVHSWNFVPTSCGRDHRPRPVFGQRNERAHEAVHGTIEVAVDAYAELLAAASKKHRVAMKLELMRHLPQVSADTLWFLLTKRRRPRALLRSDPTGGRS